MRRLGIYQETNVLFGTSFLKTEKHEFQHQNSWEKKEKRRGRERFDFVIRRAQLRYINTPSIPTQLGARKFSRVQTKSFANRFLLLLFGSGPVHVAKFSRMMLFMVVFSRAHCQCMGDR